MKAQGRIFFENNPWPEGHPVKDFQFSCGLDEDGIYLRLHLKSEDYYSEREIEVYTEDFEFLPEFEDLPDWEHPAAWENFHACTLSNTFWGAGTKLRISKKNGTQSNNTLFSIAEICNSSYTVNPIPIDDNGIGLPNDEIDDDAQTFHIYLLGHDAVANHKIDFLRHENGQFQVHWTGLIALAYFGDYQFKHKFNARISDVEFQGYYCQHFNIEDDGDREKQVRILARKYILDSDQLMFVPREHSNGCDWLTPNLG